VPGWLAAPDFCSSSKLGALPKLNTQVMVAILIPESDVDTPNLKGWSRNLKAVVTVNQSVKLMTVACHIFWFPHFSHILHLPSGAIYCAYVSHCNLVLAHLISRQIYESAVHKGSQWATHPGAGLPWCGVEHQDCVTDRRK
jgi:hypothetical protein